MGRVAQLLKPNCSVDKISKYDLTCFHVTEKKGFDTLAEESAAEARIAFDTSLDRFLEISSQRHCDLRPVMSKYLRISIMNMVTHRAPLAMASRALGETIAPHSDTAELAMLQTQNTRSTSNPRPRDFRSAASVGALNVGRVA
jgi:hypothetical protein